MQSASGGETPASLGQCERGLIAHLFDQSEVKNHGLNVSISVRMRWVESMNHQHHVIFLAPTFLLVIQFCSPDVLCYADDVVVYFGEQLPAAAGLNLNIWDNSYAEVDTVLGCFETRPMSRTDVSALADSIYLFLFSLSHPFLSHFIPSHPSILFLSLQSHSILYYPFLLDTSMVIFASKCFFVWFFFLEMTVFLKKSGFFSDTKKKKTN